MTALQDPPMTPIPCQFSDASTLVCAEVGTIPVHHATPAAAPPIASVALLVAFVCVVVAVALMLRDG